MAPSSNDTVDGFYVFRVNTVEGSSVSRVSTVDRFYVFRGTPEATANGITDYIVPLYRPPSTMIVMPVMYAAAGEQRKTTRLATSSGVP